MGLSKFVITEKYEKMFCEIAKQWAEMSYCKRGKVGALIVKDNRIIASAYNGTPSGAPNVCEAVDGYTADNVIHAEMNAILQVAKSTESIEGSVMVCTMSPCVNCAKHIANSGIKALYYLEEYRDTSGLQLLAENGVLTWEIVI